MKISHTHTLKVEENEVGKSDDEEVESKPRTLGGDEIGDSS